MIFAGPCWLENTDLISAAGDWHDDPLWIQADNRRNQ